ncbi:sorbosone dehydrogenase family protein [Adhaeribacter swui]|uniref:Sorbosone dehydrogenase family protein n=1 Tax=Adhaeribacter swui TaxID=2086471 RepID=A0A7G7G7C9_9BACT|nr:sorbosone dehydrogenase family protein [Adhaeribacter swui]QNF33063.1 sorbosone dehydrogenase family protein [Adhaeribacter swui]
MKKVQLVECSFLLALALGACNSKPQTENSTTSATETTDSTATTAANDTLPKPFATPPTAKNSKVIGWPAGKMPQAPDGFTVTKFAEKMRNPRWIYVAPNGDILVAEASTEESIFKKVQNVGTGKSEKVNTGGSANRITLFRDTNQDGKPEVHKTFLENLNQPLGMLILNNAFYVANTDGLWKYPYKEGQDQITGKGEKILDLPAGGYNNHWTRNIIANSDGSKIYISVGSGSNVAENGLDNEKRRANILEINPDGSGERVYGSGLRNPVGMDWAPGTKTLYTVVNERDNLGDDLVPDYLTSVKDGGFYGWPFAYWGPHPDPRMEKEQQPDMVKKTIVPDVALGSHTASLGLTFYDGKTFPEKYRNGAFVGQHGSWNRSEFVGYKVVFVPFKDGKPAGKPESFLTGFIADAAKSEVYGRPVGLAVLPSGALLVADDAANTIWHVQAK